MATFTGTALADTITPALVSAGVALAPGDPPGSVPSNTSDTVTGAGGNDTIDGSGGDDSLVGQAGDDSIMGGYGDDILDGTTAADAAGNDTLMGGPGDDALWDSGAPADNDSYDGGAGTDTVNYSLAAAGVNANLVTGAVTGGAGTDTLRGIENIIDGLGNDTLIGNAADNILGDDNDPLTPFPTGNDSIEGGLGEDTLRSGVGLDTLKGGEGDDLLVASDPADADNDTYDGGAGNDTVDYTATGAAITANLATGTATGAGTDTLTSIENIITGAGADAITGSAEANNINTGAGADTLIGGGGADTLMGGDGNDQYTVAATGQGTRINDTGGFDTLILPAGFTVTDNNILRKGNSLIIDLNGDGRFLPNTATPPRPLPPWGAPVTDQDLVIENFFGAPGTGGPGAGYIDVLGNLTAVQTAAIPVSLGLPNGAGPNINGDSTPDIAFRSPTTGVNGVWYMSFSAPPGGTAAVTRRFANDIIVPQADPNQRLVGMGNYSENFAGSELFWYDQATGRTGLWYNVATDGGPGNSFRSNNLLLIDEEGWEFGASANLDNGTNDGAVWYNTNTGAIAYWNLEVDPVTGLSFVNEATNYGNDPSLLGWSLRTAGDFDNDGFRDDLVWQNNTTNAIAIWYMDPTNGLERTSVLDPTAANWKVAGAGDYNQSLASGALPSSFGTTDLLLTNVVTGQNAVWSLTAATATTGPGFIGGFYIEPAPGYEAVAA